MPKPFPVERDWCQIIQNRFKSDERYHRFCHKNTKIHFLEGLYQNAFPQRTLGNKVPCAEGVPVYAEALLLKKKKEKKKAHVQFLSVSSTSGVKNILQTNQMQQHLFMIREVSWTGQKKKAFSHFVDFFKTRTQKSQATLT